MKFKAEATIEINNEDLLEIVNDQQRWDDLETFSTLEEIPMELIWLCLNEINYFVDEIGDYMSPQDFEITLIP